MESRAVLLLLVVGRRVRGGVPWLGLTYAGCVGDRMRDGLMRDDLRRVEGIIYLS